MAGDPQPSFPKNKPMVQAPAATPARSAAPACPRIQPSSLTKASGPSAAEPRQPLSEPAFKIKPVHLDLQVIKTSWRTPRISQRPGAEEAGEKTGWIPRRIETADAVASERKPPSTLTERNKEKMRNEKTRKGKARGAEEKNAAKQRARRKSASPPGESCKKPAESRQKKSPPAKRGCVIPEKIQGPRSGNRAQESPKEMKKITKPPKPVALPGHASKRRKQANRYFIMEMLGLYRRRKRRPPSRGRARAGSSG